MEQTKRNTSYRITRTKVAPNSHLLPRHDRTDSSKAEMMEEPTLLRVEQPEQFETIGFCEKGNSHMNVIDLFS